MTHESRQGSRGRRCTLGGGCVDQYGAHACTSSLSTLTGRDGLIRAQRACILAAQPRSPQPAVAYSALPCAWHAALWGVRGRRSARVVWRWREPRAGLLVRMVLGTGPPRIYICLNNYF